MEREIFGFFLITIEPIKIQTCLAPQNDGLNLSFVKDTYVDGGELARNGRKTLKGAGRSGRLLHNGDRRIS